MAQAKSKLAQKIEYENRNKLKHMEVLIRETAEKDFYQTEYLTREAFWNLYHPGCVEHMILHNLRKSKCCVRELDLVAVSDGKIVGHIISTRARIIDPADVVHDVLCVGPLSVLPELQKKGIGSELMIKSIETAKKLGYPGMILFGNPAYYHRVGFRNAQEFGITTKDGQNFDPFMALELNANALADVKGRFFEDEAFEVDTDQLPGFESLFPYKEKRVTETQFN